MLQEATTQLEHLKLVRILSSWRKYVSFSAAQRMSKEKARLHHNRVVLGKYFVALYDHHRLQLRKSLLQKQGAWFEHNRLLSFTYSKWRVQVLLRILVPYSGNHLRAINFANLAISESFLLEILGVGHIIALSLLLYCCNPQIFLHEVLFFTDL